MVSVVVVEDHASLREALVLALSDTGDIEIVGSCEDGAAAVDLVLHVRPDVVVMDLRLPVMDGAEATTRIPGDLAAGTHPHPHEHRRQHPRRGGDDQRRGRDGRQGDVTGTVDPGHPGRTRRPD